MHGSLGTLITSFQYQLKSLWNAKAVLLTECQTVPAQIAHSVSSSCAVPQTFLPLCELRATFGVGVSTSDQSLARRWMRKLIHFPNMAGLIKPFPHSPWLWAPATTLNSKISYYAYNPFTRGSFKMISSQIWQHSHLPLNLMSLTGRQATRLGKFKTFF